MEQLESTPLFVAATRPAMKAGLPLGLLILFIMGAGMIIVVIQNPLYELALIPLWMLARALVRYDYNAIGIVGLWLRTKACSFDAHRFGGASPAPFPVRAPKQPRGIKNAR